jgi:hypothetical protein
MWREGRLRNLSNFLTSMPLPWSGLFCLSQREELPLRGLFRDFISKAEFQISEVKF